MRETHIHPCGHACQCAQPEAETCVQDALYATEDVAEREAIWRQRWHSEHPHPIDGVELPEQHRP